MTEEIPNTEKLKRQKLEYLLSGNTWSLPPEMWLGEEIAAEIERRMLAFGWTDNEIGLFPLMADEAFKNAVMHGTFGIKVLEGDEEASNAAREKQIREFELSGKFKDKRVLVEIDLNLTEATIRVTDQGKGFFADAIPDPTNSSRLLEPTGRGIDYMRKICDRVSLEGSTIILYKKRQKI